jgi:beta-phosphoglucomutase
VPTADEPSSRRDRRRARAVGARAPGAVTDILLLDYNGVVVDDEPLHWAALRDVLAVERIAVDRATYDAAYLGLDDRACLREAFRRAGHPLGTAAVHRLAARKAEWYAEQARGGVPLVPGVGAFVRAAGRDGLRVAVVSGALRREIDDGLARARLTGAVATVVSAEDVAAGKPDPSGLRLAVTRLAGEAARARAVVIEDSRPGLAAARALGAGCVAIATSHRPADLAGADLVWTSFAGHRPVEIAPLLHEVDAHGQP